MKLKKTTINIQSGLNQDEKYGCIIPPITLSTTYNFLGFNQPRSYDYSRRKNPIRDLVQTTLSKLENGKDAILTSSGMSAIFLSCISFLKPNDLLIAPHDCYGGTYRLFQAMQTNKICQVEFINQCDTKQILDSIKKNPKLFFIESPSNPMLRITDIKKICNSYRRSNTIYIVDNTFMTPILQNPLQLGADLVVHSCSKYLNGHSDLIAGIVISKNKKITEQLSWWANTLGITSSAFDCYQLLRGIKTLHLRIYQQQLNTKKIIKFLTKQKKIKTIFYPGLSNHPNYDIACQQQKGFGAIFSFELYGNQKTLKNFLENLKLFTLAESFGGIESLIAHPATMTHAAMSNEARIHDGISNTLLRISVGLEDSKDLINDFKKAFQKI